MKIAIASKGKELTSEVSETVGRSNYFLILENNELIESVENEFKEEMGRIGPRVAQMLGEKNVSRIIGKQFGEKIRQSLMERNIKYEETTEDKVSQLLEN